MDVAKVALAVEELKSTHRAEMSYRKLQKDHLATIRSLDEEEFRSYATATEKWLQEQDAKGNV